MDTTIILSGSKPTLAWAARSAAHADGAELEPFSRASPAATARTFPPRRRFDIRSNLDIVFTLIQKGFLFVVLFKCNQFRPFCLFGLKELSWTI